MNDYSFMIMILELKKTSSLFQLFHFQFVFLRLESLMSLLKDSKVKVTFILFA